MKNLILILLFYSFTMFYQANAQNGWSYKIYKTIYNGSVKQFTLEYGIKQTGHNGYVRWRLTNHTNTTFYDVSINDKAYTLVNNETVSMPGVTVTSTLGPGETKAPSHDPVNSAAYAMSDNYDNPVKLIKIKYPEITLRLKRNGTEYPWDNIMNNETSTSSSSKTTSVINNGNNLSTKRNGNEYARDNLTDNETVKSRPSTTASEKNNGYNLSSKKNEYLSYIKKGDQAYNSSNWSEAAKHYNAAVTMDFDPDMYPSLPTRYSIIQKLAKTKSNINKANRSSGNQNFSSSNYTASYNNSSNNYSNNNSNQTYRKTTYKSYQNTSTNNNTRNQSTDDHWEQWAENYKRQAQASEIAAQESLNELSNTITHVASMYAQASREAEQKKQAEERRREEQEARREAERQREYDAKLHASRTMKTFENNFNNRYNGNLNNAANDRDGCVYFYFGTFTQNFDNKRGNAYLSNIFPVYKVGKNQWPYMSDLKNEISRKYGNVIIRGYFNTKQAAISDQNKMINDARNSFYDVNVNEYIFSFNSPSTSQSPNTDIWGNSVKNETTTNTDFWGNKSEKTNEIVKEKESEIKKDTLKKEVKTETDFWGNKIDNK